MAFSQKASLEITVENIRNENGSLRVGLFGSEADFLKKITFGKMIKINGSEVSVIFDEIPAGDYGISIIHDENENGELDTNKIGIPTEGFGFGNNATGKMRPATFDKAKVVLKHNPVHQIIKLKYFN